MTVSASLTKQIKIQEIAKSWVGTPYYYQARIKGKGVDCLGLVVGIWEELYDKPFTEKLPPYSPEWLGSCKREDLIENISRYLKEIPLIQAKDGDVVLFRIRPLQSAKHCAILVNNSREIIHAYTGHGVVMDEYTVQWRRRATKAFRFNKKKV